MKVLELGYNVKRHELQQLDKAKLYTIAYNKASSQESEQQ
jgi:hypothetical protein